MCFFLFFFTGQSNVCKRNFPFLILPFNGQSSFSIELKNTRNFVKSADTAFTLCTVGADIGWSAGGCTPFPHPPLRLGCLVFFFLLRIGGYYDMYNWSVINLAVKTFNRGIGTLPAANREIMVPITEKAELWQVLSFMFAAGQNIKLMHFACCQGFCILSSFILFRIL